MSSTTTASAVAELDALVADLADTQRELSGERGRLDAKISRAHERHAQRIIELEQRSEATQQAIVRLFVKHRARIVKGNAVNGVACGLIKIVRTPERVEIDDEKGLIARLLANRRTAHFVRTRQELDKAALKKERPDVEGVTFVSGESLVITPAATQQDLRVPLP